MRWGGRITRSLLVIQAAAMLVATGIAYAAGGTDVALAAAAGGVIGMAGMLYFSLRLFAAAPGSPARQVLRAFYTGAALKIVLTVVLLAVAIAVLELAFLPLLGGYAATLLAYWMILPMVIKETGGK